jgi:hypothetical protein
MAWDDFDAEDGQGFTGDKPIDQFSSCLSRIAQAYEERFGRKPRLIGVLHALEQVVDTDPSRYLCDVEEGESVRLRVWRSA